MCTYRSKWDYFFQIFPFPQAWVNCPPWLQSCFGWRAIHPPTLGWPTTCNNFILGGFLRKRTPFFWPFFFQTHFTNYQPHSRTCNPSSPSYIFGEPNILVSSVSKNNAHNSISSTIACSIVSHHKFHESWFDNNNHAKFAFHRFVWNRHKCHSSICTIWTSMSCALFRHQCHMHVRIVWTQMLCTYLYCLHMHNFHV